MIYLLIVLAVGIGAEEVLASHEISCLYKMEAAMREHDAIDDEINRHAKAFVPPEVSGLEDEPEVVFCYGVEDGCKRARDDRFGWTPEERIKTRQKMLARQTQELEERRAWEEADQAWREAINVRKKTFQQQWAEAKRECWREP